jgi:HEPN domain-containing protein
MSVLTAEWVKKAEDDFTIAGRELRVRKNPIYDGVCFHSQQCAEKYLKAFLNEYAREAPKIHNLLDLLKLCKELDLSLEILQADLRIVERFSVGIRYPGLSADKEDAKSAYRAAQIVRAAMRQKLGLVTK